MKAFKNARRVLGDIDTAATAHLLGMAADICLVLDAKGVVRDVAFGSDDLSRALSHWPEWIGKSWASTVTVESVSKVEALLALASDPPSDRGRQLNHPVDGQSDVPVLYTLVTVPGGDRRLAMGRDLRSLSALQQRLMDAQQAMEREMGRLRLAEIRHRLVFHAAAQPMLVVDATSLRVVESNGAADRLLGAENRSLTGQTFPAGVPRQEANALREAATVAASLGRSEVARVRVRGEGEASALLQAFRHEGQTLLLVQFSIGAQAVSRPDLSRDRLGALARHSLDAMVVTDRDGRVQSVNHAFLDLVQLSSGEQAGGQSLERWLGRSAVDLGVLLTNLRQHGTIRHLATRVRDEHGTESEVEVAGVALDDADEGRCYGFTLRRLVTRVAPDPRIEGELPRSVSQLTELVGRVKLKELVREATEVIERLCIETALELTADNRASAAEMLGLSRQSLYVKLHRYGLGDLAPEAPA